MEMRSDRVLQKQRRQTLNTQRLHFMRSWSFRIQKRAGLTVTCEFHSRRIVHSSMGIAREQFSPHDECTMTVWTEDVVAGGKSYSVQEWCFVRLCNFKVRSNTWRIPIGSRSDDIFDLLFSHYLFKGFYNLSTKPLETTEHLGWHLFLKNFSSLVLQKGFI